MTVKTRRAIVSTMRALALPIVAALLLGGCGPISGLTYLVRARIDMHLAESAGSEKHSVYEHFAAREYMQKAKEEYGYSDFIAADKYARKADEYAKKARDRSEAAAQTP